MTDWKPLNITARSIHDPLPTSDPNLMGIKRNMFIDSEGYLRKRPGFRAAHFPHTNTGPYQDNVCVNGLKKLSRSSPATTQPPYYVGTVDYIEALGSFPWVSNVFRFQWDGRDFTNTATDVYTMNRNFALTIAKRQARIFRANNYKEVIIVIPGVNKIMVYNYIDNTRSLGNYTSIGDSQPLCACYVDGYVIIAPIASTGQPSPSYYFTEPFEYTNFPVTNFSSAEGVGDSIYNMVAGAGEFYVFGSESIEIIQNDGVLPFSRIPGGLIPIRATTSVTEPAHVQEKQTFYFFDDKAALLSFNGRQIKPVAPYLTRYLNRGYPNHEASSVFAFNYLERNFLLSYYDQFGVRTIYDTDLDDWYVWDHGASDTFTSLNWFSAIDSVRSDQFLTGIKDAKEVYAYDDSYYTEVGGRVIRAGFTTGWIRHETDTRKLSHEVSITAHIKGDEPRPKIYIRYRDDGNEDWKNTRELDLASFNNYFVTFSTKALGSYRQRQYQIWTDSESPFRVSRMAERITYCRV